MKYITFVRNFLKGKKTFFIAALLVVLSGLKAQGYLDDSTYTVIMGILGGLGLATLRAGLGK